MQTTDHVLMVRPAHFMANPETMFSNAFQKAPNIDVDAQALALGEFDGYVAALRTAGVNVWVHQDRMEPHTPDSIFPNNWVTFHADGTVVLYPMEAPNRRLERREEILSSLEEAFDIRRRVDLSAFESRGRYLEGTGSMVLDRENGLAYLCRSSRTHSRVVRAFAAHMGYRPIWFNAADELGQPIYHTNVMMSVGRKLAIVCLESIRDSSEREEVEQHLRNSGKTVVDITYDQVKAFAGNMIELKGHQGLPVLAMSRQAWDSLSVEQVDLIVSQATPVVAPIPTIESCGGGGTRCMVAEIHLPQRQKENMLKVG